MKRHPFALAFSERRMAQPDSNVRRAPALPQKKLAPLPTSTKPARWGNEKPQFGDDLLVGAISHLLRHEEDGQSVEDHDVSSSVIDCVLALCEFFEEQIPPEPPEEIQFRAGQILRLLEVAGARGQDAYSLMLATELSAQELLDAIRKLQRSNIAVRPELNYAGHLELLFILETKLPNIGGAR